MTIKLTDVFKQKNSDHDKIIPPEQTIETFKTRTAQADLNILKKTWRIDNGRIDIPVYFSECGHDARQLTGTKKQMGKGSTPALAEASAVMELAERFSLYSFMDIKTNFQHSSLDMIMQALPFNYIAASVHDTASDKIEKNRQIFSMLELKWANAYNLTRDEEIKIPLDWFFMINEFNGSSAGNCYEEAVCQGICETVERHVSAVISRDKPSIPRIDPESIENRTTKNLIKKFTDAGIKLYINDFSLDTGIPTVGILAYDPSTFPDSSEIVWTAGTAPSPDKALSRALTEVAQLAGDFNTSSNYVASGLPKFTTLEQADFIIGPQERGTCKTVSINSLPDISDINIKEEILAITRAMERLGFEIILLNITDPRLSIPACYTILPGTFFRERAENASIAMFAAKHVYSTSSPEKAMEKLTAMAEILPDQYVFEFYLGLCHLTMEALEKALIHLERAMVLDPPKQDIPSICSYTGVCLKELGRFDQALKILEKGADMDKEREDIYNLMGFCNFMLKRHELSIACFKAVLKLNPGSGIDHASIASNYRELGDTQKAVEYYERALALDPALDFARENLQRLL